MWKISASDTTTALSYWVLVCGGHSLAPFLALGKPQLAKCSLIDLSPDVLELAQLQMRLTCSAFQIKQN
jgi:hypothetical protein